MNLLGEAEVTGLRLQLSPAGRRVFCGEESTLAAPWSVCWERVSDLLGPVSAFCTRSFSKSGVQCSLTSSSWWRTEKLKRACCVSREHVQVARRDSGCQQLEVGTLRVPVRGDSWFLDNRPVAWLMHLWWKREVECRAERWEKGIREG